MFIIKKTQILQRLKANIEYTTPHGHVYRTDHKGRIKEVYAEDLSLKR